MTPVSFKSILIVDDEDRIAKHIANQLEEAGYKAYTANNGKMAQTVLQKNPNLNLVITDLGMPAMSGLGLLNYIRSEERFAELPCMVMTSHIQEDLVKKAAQKNVIKYLLKPVKVKDLISEVEKVIGPAKSRLDESE